MKKLLIILSLLLLPSLTLASTEKFEKAFKKAEATIASEQNKGLKSYICDVKTTQFDTMMKKMTSAMPENLPRPEKPSIKKYWDKNKGMIIRLEGKNIFPYMQQVSQKMSEQFALDLYGYFLPSQTKKLRHKLLKGADKQLEIISGYHRFTITFKEKTDIKMAFFKGGLPIPTKDVKSITISVDMERKLVKDIYIKYDKTEGYQEYKLLAEYKKIDDKYFLYNLYLMSDDHSVMIGFRTDFDKIDGYILPVKQIRTGEGSEIPEEEKRIEVEFTNYKINTNIPAEVFGKKKK